MMSVRVIAAILVVLPLWVVALLYLLRYPEVALGLYIFGYVLEGGGLLPVATLSAVLLGVAIVGFLAPVLISGRPTPFNLQATDLCLYCFVILLFAGSYLTPAADRGFVKAVRFSAAVFVPYALTRVFIRRYDQVRRLLLAILFAGVSVGVLVFAVADRFATAGRLYFVRANPIVLGELFSVGVLVALAVILGQMRRGSRVSKVFAALLIPLLTYSLLKTGSRGPTFALVIGAAFCIALLLKASGRLKLGAAIAAVTGMVILGLLYGLGGDLTTWLNLLPRYYHPEFILRGMPTMERIEQVRLAVGYFRESPLLGMGTMAFGQLTEWSYPHNIFLEVAVENGLLGLILFGGFLVLIARQAWAFLTFDFPRLDPRSQTVAAAVLAITLSFLVMKQFSFSLDMNKDLFIFLGLVENLPALSPRGTAR